MIIKEIQQIKSIHSNQTIEQVIDLENKIQKYVEVERMPEEDLKQIEKGICPYCKVKFDDLGTHLKEKHPDKYNEIVIHAWLSDMPLAKIGNIFKITLKDLEKIILKEYGINIASYKKKSKIKAWGPPKHYKYETTTVWSFKSRGNWATHSGAYRGNWSPYIPRNVILKYTKKGDVVLDYFSGSGTTAVEAKLLGRRCIARDINPGAVKLTKINLDFPMPLTLENDAEQIEEPDVKVGDARNLSDIPDESIDLICAHPPYAGIITYSADIEGDLSKLKLDVFLKEMRKVADGSLRVLKPGKKCAILIGDSRKNKRVIPIGFETIRVFLDAGFKLKELIIKRQHNCRSTGFWYNNSLKYNFLLLAHEYLPIFEKPAKSTANSDSGYDERLGREELPFKEEIKDTGSVKENGFETTTVWIFPEENMQENIIRNVLKRFVKDSKYIQITVDSKSKISDLPELNYTTIIHWSDEITFKNYNAYQKTVLSLANRFNSTSKENTYLIIETKDIRDDQGYVIPSGLKIYEILKELTNLQIKEIIIIVPENYNSTPKDNYEIIHRYLLVYEFKREQTNGKT